ncbi:MAG: serine/threonine protein kinase [Planctomycetes bacterium]|nr:serine/threonine protein kinase [Planctomycetota bacterium]
MSIRITCPNPECERSLKLKDELAGKKIRCPDCHGAIRVPGRQDADDELVGRRLAHYEIISKIGSGGMGAVYRARNLSLNKIVALKILPPSLPEEDPSFVKRFIREAQSTAQLDHPNVVTVHYVGSEDDYHFIEMEYVDGRPLRDLLRDPDNITIAQATRITMDAAKALASAHDKGIIHRDVTPDNILITTDGKVKVADFGLASMGDDEERVRKGKVFGTPYYMSPEHCRGLESDARSDIYSLGATYYHLLTGEPPYYGERPETIVRMHVKAAVPSPQAIYEDIPDEVDKIVMKMMAKDPDDRYQSCDELIDDLEDEALAVASEESTRSMVSGESGDDDVEVVRHSPVANVFAGVAGALLAVLIAAAVFVYLNPFPTPVRPKSAPQTAPAKPPQAQAAESRPKPAAPAPEAKGPPATAKAEGPDKPEPKPKPAPPEKPEAEAPAQEAKPPEAAPPAKPTTPPLDTKAYASAVREIDKLVDNRKYDKALVRLKDLAEKMPPAGVHIAIKQDNIARLKKQWARLLSADLKGKPPIPMGSIVKKYGYAGTVIDIQDTGIAARSKVTTHIKWDRLSKAESLALIEKVLPPKDADTALGLAAFCMEGTEKLFGQAVQYLGAARGLGADVTSLIAELAFLRTLCPSTAPPPAPKDEAKPSAAKAAVQESPPPAKSAKKKGGEKKEAKKKEDGAVLRDLRKKFKRAVRYPFSSASHLAGMKVQLPPNPRFARGRNGKALIIEPKRSVEIPVAMPKNAGMIEFLVLLSGPKANFMLAAGSDSPPKTDGQRGGGAKPHKSAPIIVQVAGELRVSFQKTANGKPVQLQSKGDFPWEKWVRVSIYWGPDGHKLFINEKLAAEGEGKGLGSNLRSLSFANRIPGGGQKGQKPGQQPAADTLVVLNEVILYASMR